VQNTNETKQIDSCKYFNCIRKFRKFQGNKAALHIQNTIRKAFQDSKVTRN